MLWVVKCIRNASRTLTLAMWLALTSLCFSVATPAHDRPDLADLLDGPISLVPVSGCREKLTKPNLLPDSSVRPANDNTAFNTPRADLDLLQKQMGNLMYNLRDTNLFLSTLMVNEAYRGQRVSTYLLAYILASNPEVTSVSLIFAGSNLEAYKVGLAWNLEPKEALKLTPAYRVLSRWGYVNIVKDSILASNFVSVTLER